MRKKVRLLLYVLGVAVLLFGSVSAALAAPAYQQGTPTPGAAGATQPAAATTVRSFQATRLVGFPVMSTIGDEIGEIQSLIVEFNSGSDEGVGATQPVTGTGAMTGTGFTQARLAYAVVALGGTLGLGEKPVAVPLTAMGLNENGDAFVLNVQPALLGNVPTFRAPRALGEIDPTWDRDIRGFWRDRGIWLPASIQNGVPYRANTLIGWPVVNEEDDEIGEIENMVVEISTGAPNAGPGATQGVTGTTGTGVMVQAMPVVRARLAYAVVALGGFLGLGEERIPVPFSGMRLNREDETFTLPVDPQTFRDAPTIRSGALPQEGDPDWDRDIESYWADQGFVVGAELDEAEARLDRETRLALAPGGSLFEADRLIGFPVVDREGEELGEVQDLVLVLTSQDEMTGTTDLAMAVPIGNARLAYAIVAYGGFLGLGETLVPVPLQAMRLNLEDPDLYGLGPAYGYPYGYGYYGYPDGVEDPVAVADEDVVLQDAFVLDADRAALEAVPGINLDALPNVTDPNFDAAIRDYWEGRGVQFPEATQDRRAFRASNLMGLFGYVVKTPDGEELGEIENILLQLDLAVAADEAGATTGAAATDVTTQVGLAGAPIRDATVRFAVVAFGGFLGLGEEQVPVPFSAMQYDQDLDEDAFYLNTDRAVFENAPILADLGRINDGGFTDDVNGYWEGQGFGPFEE